MDCQICYEPLNASTRASVNCSKECGTVRCRECVQRFIVGNAPHRPSCMGCGETWSDEFVGRTMTKKFVSSEIAGITRQRLFEQEQMRFPDTQRHIVHTRLRRKRGQLNRTLAAAKVSMRRKLRMAERYSLGGEEALVALELSGCVTLQADVLRMTGEISEISGEIRSSRPKGKKNPFVKGCCREPCRGFLSTGWKCGVCEEYSCSKCHEPKDDDHQCDPDNVATVKLLAKDTKRCPKCACGVTKISGCDHMWCTNCNTGFSWRSGLELDNSVQTNTLYYEYMRRTQGSVPRAPGDCGAPQDYTFFTSLYDLQECIRRSTWDPPSLFAAERLHMYCEVQRHMQLVESLWLNRDTEPEALKLRIRYLEGDMTKRSFVQTLKNREAASVGNQVVRDLVDTFCNVMQRLLSKTTEVYMEKFPNWERRNTNFMDAATVREFQNMVVEMDHLVQLTNTVFAETRETYGRKNGFALQFVDSAEAIVLRVSSSRTVRYETGRHFATFDSWENCLNN
mgnify:CR=1 FL=1